MPALDASSRPVAGARGLVALGVSKAFKGRPVLRDIDLAVPPGRIAVIKGPNGVGKTTLLRIFATVVRPDTGDAWVDGASVCKQAGRVRERIGVAFVNERSLFWRLSGRENLRLFARTRGVGRAAADAQIDTLLDEFDMREVAPRRVADVSAGQRQRLILMRAALGDPSVYLLDEPLRGLDEPGVATILEFIRARAEEGRTVLVVAPTIEHFGGLDADWLRLEEGRLLSGARPEVSSPP
jgi:ABC-2 type transport system ATP-binding protein